MENQRASVSIFNSILNQYSRLKQRANRKNFSYELQSVDDLKKNTQQFIHHV